MYVLWQLRTILNEKFELFPNSWGLSWRPPLGFSSIDERCWSAPVKCSPRTNIEGRHCRAKQKCQQSKAAKTPSVFFFSLPPHTVSTVFDCWLGIKNRSSEVRFDQPSSILAGSSILRWMDTVMLAVIDLRRLFTTFRVHSVSLYLKWHALAFCPAATCYQRACQPWAHTVDPGRCPQVDTGVEGAEQAEWRRRQKEKKKE